MVRIPDLHLACNHTVNILQSPIARRDSEQGHIAFLQLSIPSKVDCIMSDACSEIPCFAYARGSCERTGDPR